MKFSVSAVAALLTLSTSVSALPASASALSVIESRVITPISVIDATLKNLEVAFLTSEKAIVASLGRGTAGLADAVEVIAAEVNKELHDIAIEFATTAKIIADAGEEAAKLIAADVGALVQQDIDILIEDAKILEKIAKDFQLSLTVILTNLEPALEKAIKAELSLVTRALSAVVNPLVELVRAVAKAGLRVELVVKGLAEAAKGLTDILGSLLTILGLHV